MPLILLLLCLLATTITGAITNVPSNELDENQAIAASNEDLPSLFDLNFMSDASEITAVSSNTTKSLSHGQERLRSLNYQFGNSSIHTELVQGHLHSFSFSHLSALLHNQSVHDHWVIVYFFVPSWPLTSIMTPRVNYTAHLYPNMTFLAVDCTNVSSFMLQSWDIVGMPSLVIYKSRFNLADHSGTAVTNTLVNFISGFTSVQPTLGNDTNLDLDFDDVTLRSADLPQFDPLVICSLVALVWGVRWLLSKTAIFGPILNFNAD